MEKLKKLAGESPLAETEKDEIIHKEYAPKAHRIGLTFSLIHIVIFFLPPLYIMFYYNIPVNWGAVVKGSIATLSVSAPFWFIEPISYFVILGIAGTYLSFLAGNISNFRLPVSAVAQEVAGVREGSHEGEVVSTLAIVATQLMLTLATLCGAIFVTIVVKFLPKGFIAAFDWLLPSIWGAIVVQFGLRKWQYAVVAILGSIYIVIYSPLPGWSHVPILVFFMAILGLKLYSKKIWLIAGVEKKDTGKKEGQPTND
jgi:hypothetical protein